jgi:hypothetical protein
MISAPRINNSQIQSSFPRAWASSTPPTCAALDGLRTLSQAAARLSLRSRGSCAQNFHHPVVVPSGVLSWPNHYRSNPIRHAIPLQQFAPNFRLLQNPASGFPALRKSYGRSRRHRLSITLPESLSEVATHGLRQRTIRPLAQSSAFCTRTRVGVASNTSCAKASSRGGPRQSAPANARLPMSSAANSCNYRFTINPRRILTPDRMVLHVMTKHHGKICC